MEMFLSSLVFYSWSWLVFRGLLFCRSSSVVEHALGKGEVGGSIPPCGIFCFLAFDERGLL